MSDMDDWNFYDAEMSVEVLASGDPDWPVEVILPSEIRITAEQARRFGLALLKAADALEAS